MIQNLKFLKLILIFVAFISGINKAFPIMTTYNIDGYWAPWKYNLTYDIQGAVDNFVLYGSYDHPSVFALKVKIDNYHAPTKKEIKNHIKNDSWFEYSGTVEYWVSEEYPTIKDALKQTGEFVKNPDTKAYTNPNSGVKAKRTAKAKILMKFYEDGIVHTIKITFDSIGYAIGLN